MANAAVQPKLSIPAPADPAVGRADAPIASSLGLFDSAGEMRGTKRAPIEPPRSRRAGDLILRALTAGAAAVIPILLLIMSAVLVLQAWPSITHYGLGFLTAVPTAAVPFGPSAAIQGTCYAAVIALFLAGPIGVLIAVFLAELAPRAIRLPLSFLIELLAAIPSIVYGLWALFVLVPIFLNDVNPFMARGGRFFLFAEASPSGQEILAAAVVLSVMIVPTIAAISRDVIAAVPASQREAMYALGATRWETIWKVVLPYARTGIIGGAMLGLGRAVGETMAVQMVIGGAYTGGWSLLRAGATIPFVIVNQLTEATGFVRSAILELALVLLIMTIVINAAARALVWTVNRRFTA